MAIRNWRGPEFQRMLRAEVLRRLAAAALLVVNRAKELLSVAGTAKGAKGKGRKYGARRSSPGEPPYKQTGRLRASVSYEVGEKSGQPSARAGTNLKYGFWLELGTKFIKPRPWLRRAYQEMLARIRAILTQPWNPT